jgi:hypothetical protein
MLKVIKNAVLGHTYVINGRPEPGSTAWLELAQAKNTKYIQQRVKVDEEFAKIRTDRSVEWNASHKEERNARLRALRAAAREAGGKGPGKPKNPAVEPIAPVESIVLAQPLVHELQHVSDIDVPKEFQTWLSRGEHPLKLIPISKNHPNEWPTFSNVKRFDKLKPKTVTSYLASCRKAVVEAGYNMPKTKKTYTEIVQQMLGDHCDPWKILRNVMNKETVSQQNELAKGLLGVTCAFHYDLFSKGDTSSDEALTLLRWTHIFQKANGITRMHAKEKHESQTFSATALANFITWQEWHSAVRKFQHSVFTQAGSLRKGVTLEKLRDVVLASCYSERPPVRNDMATVQWVSKKPKEDASGNYLWLDDPLGAAFYWTRFKNMESFSGSLPLRLPIDTDLAAPDGGARLLMILKAWRAAMPDSKWMFPRNLDKPTLSWTNEMLGERLTDIAEKLTGKRAGVLVLRPAFITYYWLKHPHAANNLQQLQKDMYFTHQKSVAINMSYNKTKAIEILAEEAAAAKEIDGEFLPQELGGPVSTRTRSATKKTK